MSDRRPDDEIRVLKDAGPHTLYTTVIIPSKPLKDEIMGFCYSAGLPGAMPPGFKI